MQGVMISINNNFLCDIGSVIVRNDTTGNKRRDYKI